MLTITPINTGWIPADPRVYWYYSAAVQYKNVPEGKILFPDFVFLIEGGERLMLVDAGMPCADKVNRTHSGTHRGACQSEDMTLKNQLARLGYGMEDIETVFFTHLHWDHVGGLEEIRNARLLVSASELAFAYDPIPPYYKSYDWKIPGERAPYTGRTFETISGETEIMPGVIAFPTPGHTPGHCSLAVSTQNGEYCIAGDALFTPDNLEPVEELGWDCVSPGKVCDIVDSWHSVERIKEKFGDREKLLISHDPSLSDRTAAMPVIGR